MSRSRLVTIALAALGTLLLAGCGEETSADGADAAGTTDSYCDDLVALSTAEPEVPADASEEQMQQTFDRFYTDEVLPLAERVAESAPESSRPQLERMLELMETEGQDSFANPEYGKLNAQVQTAAIDDCDIASQAIEAVDYAYQNAPATLEAGVIGLRFENKGQELHEMAVLRRNDGVTQSFAEVLKLPRPDLDQKIRGYGGYLAEPGEADARIVRLPAGDYVLVCTVKVGARTVEEHTTQELGPASHFARGMVHEFTVR